jgi:hypothetical protein
MDKKTMYGYLGSALLILGVFSPIVRLPAVGSLDYFRNGEGDGVFVLAFGVLSLLACLRDRFRILWLTGLGSLCLLGLTYYRFQDVISDLRLQMGIQLGDKAFRGVASLAAQSVELQWGWVVLVLGAVLLLASAKREYEARALNH